MVAQKGRRREGEDQYQVTSRRIASEAVMEREKERWAEKAIMARMKESDRKG